MFFLQAFSTFLLRSRPLIEGHFKQLETAINITFQPYFHFAFVTHLIKGKQKLQSTCIFVVLPLIFVAYANCILSNEILCLVELEFTNTFALLNIIQPRGIIFWCKILNIFYEGYRHPDASVVTRVVRVLDFALELVSRYKNNHKYDVNVESAPYLAGILANDIRVVMFALLRDHKRKSRSRMIFPMSNFSRVVQ